jgi:hypothetical protein
VALEPRLTPAVTFSAQQTFAVGAAPSAMAAADFNGDGRPDLVTVSNSSVSVLLNTTLAGAGTPSFTVQQTFAGGPNEMSVVTADFNGDGRPDLAVLNFGATPTSPGAVSVLLNTTPAGSASLSFAPAQSFAVGAAPRGLSMGDFNGDGRPDLVVSNNNDGTVSVLLNTMPAGASTPTFAAQQTFATGSIPQRVAVGDFNGDGRPDLAVGLGNTAVAVMLNTTPAGATAASFAAAKTFSTMTDFPVAVAAGDFNGDGRPDIAFLLPNAGEAGVLLNTTTVGASTPSFAAAQLFAVGSQPPSLAVGDFDGDGRPDLAVPNGNGKTVSVLINTTAAGASTPSFAAQQTFGVGNNAQDVAVADFNGDGRPDLAVSNLGDSTVSVLLNTTAPFASTTPVVVGKFGSTGVWEFNQAFNSWVQLTPANASRLAADPLGDVAGEFKGFGVWLFRPSSGWHQIGSGDASLLALDAHGDVAGEFPGAGVWLFRPTLGFQQIGTSDASTLAMDAQGDVAGTFPGHGVWEFRPSIGFQQIGGSDASVLTMDAPGDVIGTFPGAGIWEYRLATGFQQINSVDATALAADPLGHVVASFAGVGVGQYQPTVGWRLILPAVAAVLGMDALGDVFGEFPGFGVWEAGPFRFGTQIRASDASVLIVA